MLSTNNQKILAFYNANKHLDFEQINLLFIELIEKLNKDIMKSAETSLSNELLKDIFQKVDKIEHVQNNLNENISVILNSISNIHNFLSEQKSSYIQEIRTTMDTILENKQMSNNEKIQTILDKNQTRTIEKTKILLSESFSNCNEELYNKIIINIQKHFESLNSATSQLLEQNLTKIFLIDFKILWKKNILVYVNQLIKIFILLLLQVILLFSPKCKINIKHFLI